MLAISAGTQSAHLDYASAQTPAFTGAVMPITDPFASPLTNNLGFTNSLVQVTNLTAIQMSDVLGRLLSLQTNIEASLPVLSFLTTNINVTTPPQTTQFGAIQPITSNPAPLTPTGAASGRQPATSFSLIVGTNIFTIDPSTLQALVTLRNDLELALPELQALNGTTPTNISSAIQPSAVNTLAPSPVRNGFFTPFTNMPAPLIPGF